MSALLTSACASGRGWRLNDERTCERDASPRVCVQAEPDRGHVLALGDVELLPGECVAADDEARGGNLRVTTRSPRGEARRRWVWVRRGRITRLAIDDRGRVEVDRDRCSDRP
ncbi:hypothetical protein ACNOYE_37275 [Nannocystaceae bacterium ST9]